MGSAKPRLCKSNGYFKNNASKQHRSRRAFFETLEVRNLLTNTLYPGTPGHYEYPEYAVGNLIPEEFWIDRVNEGPLNVSSTPVCMGGGIPTAGDYSDPIDIDYEIGGTAIEGEDYIGLASGTVTIPAGEWCKALPTFYLIEDDVEDWTFTYNEATEEYEPFLGYTITLEITGFPSGYVVMPFPIWGTAGFGDDDYPGPPPENWPSCDCSSEGQINSQKGTPIVSTTDLTSNTAGTAWSVNHKPGFDGPNNFSQGTVVGQQPYLTWREDPVAADTLEEIDEQVESKLAVVLDENTVYYFDGVDHNTSYEADPLIQATLIKDGETFIFTQADGTRYTFHGVGTYVTNRERGKLISYIDAGGNEITMNYGPDGKLASTERVIGSGLDEVVEEFLYTYYDAGDNYGEVKDVTLQRTVGGGDPAKVRVAAYEYYDSASDYGNHRDLRTVTIKEIKIVEEEEVEVPLDTMYYRYYTEETRNLEDEIIGYAHGLKFVVDGAAYQRMLEAESETDADSLSDEEVAAYADRYFEYDENNRVKKEIVGDSGSTEDNGQAEYHYAYNPGSNSGPNGWAMEFTETLPGGNENIVYTNERGQVMLKVFHELVDEEHPENDPRWYTYTRYDDEWRSVLTASSPAVTGYNPSYPALLDYNDEAADWQYLDNDDGLITVNVYYSDDTDTEFPGQPHGYLESTRLREGELGDDVLQSHVEYISRTEGDVTIWLVAASYAYPTETDDWEAADRLETLYTYNLFYTDTVQVQKQTVEDPSHAETITIFDIYGRPIWTKDPAGYIRYTEYDPKTGAVALTWNDVATDWISYEPSGWTTPSGGGQPLVTSYENDALGRTTKVTDGNTNATYTVYNDTNNETRMYPAWGYSSYYGGGTAGPVVVTRENRALGFTENLTVSFTNDSSYITDGAPNGTDPITEDTLQSLTRTYFNQSGQVIQRDDYVSFDGMTYSFDALHPGTANENYLVTTFEYDDRGRLIRQVRAPDDAVTHAETVYRTVYDSLGRVISEWVGDGDDDVVTGDWSPTNAGNMLKTHEYEYDEGDVGPGNLTSQIDTLDDSLSKYRTTTYAYDFRNRQKTVTLQDPDGVGSQVSPVFRTEYDNLGRVIRQTDATGPMDGGNIDLDAVGHYTTYEYDDENRTTTVTGPDADDDSGTTGDSPVTITVANSRGLIESQTNAIGGQTTYEYDGAGRLITLTEPDPDTGDSNPAPYTTYIYDNVGNIIEETSPLRDASSWGRNHTYFSYDSSNRLVSQNGDGPVTSYSYDAAGNRMTLTADQVHDWYSYSTNTTTWYYDALGHVTGEVNPLNLARNFLYDAAGRLIQKTDRMDRVIKYEYNLLDQVKFEKWYEPDGTTLVRTISYQFDDAGQLTAVDETDGSSTPVAAAYDYGYDLLGRRTSDTQDLIGGPDTAYASKYDVNGFRTELTASFGATADFKNTYVPDYLQRLSTLKQEGNGGNTVAAKSVSFSFNNAGQFTKIGRYADATWTELAINSFYSYDELGRLTQLIHSLYTGSSPPATSNSLNRDWLTYGYDDASQIISRGNKFSFATDVFTYDGSGQLTNDGFYDAGGNRLGDGMGPNNQLLSDSTNTYVYDNEGNRSRRSEIATADTVDYQYDHRNRLTRVIESTGDMTTDGWGTDSAYFSGWYDYQYISSLGIDVSAVPQGDNITLQISALSNFGIYYWVEDISAIRGTDYWVDPSDSDVFEGYTSVSSSSGARIEFPTAATYDGDAKSFAIHIDVCSITCISDLAVLEADIYGLTQVRSVDYEYDAFNQLVHRKLDSDGPGSGTPTDIFYSYENGQVALQFDGDSASDLSHRYLWGPSVDQLLADENVGGPLYWTLGDNVGTIRDLATHNSSTHATTVDNRREYDAFGTLLSETNSAIDSIFGYTGRQFDEATGLQCNLNRWYDSFIQKWITEDPIGFEGDPSNLYRYVGNLSFIHNSATFLNISARDLRQARR